MRRIVGSLLALVGGFLIVVGLLAVFYAPGKLMVTPVDVDSTTRLEGTAQLAGSGGVTEVPVKATSVTLANSEKSTDEVVVFTSSTCLVKAIGEVEGCVSADDPEERLISASTDNFAADRKSALAVNDPDLLPAEAETKEGLVNKWPFEAEKKTYPYWDGLVGESVDAVFDRVDDVDGLEVYVYKVSIEGVEIELTEGVPGTYNDSKEIWVEPLTGSIVNQIDHQERLDEDGEPFLILDLRFTDEQAEASADEAAENADRLGLVRDTVPWIGFGLGIPMLIVGLGLIALDSRRRSGAEG